MTTLNNGQRLWGVRWRLGAIARLMATVGAIASCSADAPSKDTPGAEAPATETSPEAAIETTSAGEAEQTSDIKVIVTLTSLTADLVHTLDEEK